MGDSERERLRVLYEEGPQHWPQADALAAALGLRREDVLTGEDLARRMNTLLQQMAGGALDPYDMQDLERMWEEGPRKCAAFSPAASSLLLSAGERYAAAVIAITGELVVFDEASGRCRVIGEIPLEGWLEESLRRLAAALREEGRSRRLIARIEGWIAAGNAPSFGADLARLTGDESLPDAARRWDIERVLAALEAWPDLLQHPRPVLRAVQGEGRLEGWLREELQEALDLVQSRPWSSAAVSAKLALGGALLALFDAERIPRWELPSYTRSVLAALDGERRPDARRALAALAESELKTWPTSAVFELRGLLADAAAEAAQALPREGAAARAAGAALDAILAFAEGNAARALRLLREGFPEDERMAEGQRYSLLCQVRATLREHLGLPDEEDE